MKLERAESFLEVGGARGVSAGSPHLNVVAEGAFEYGGSSFESQHHIIISSYQHTYTPHNTHTHTHTHIHTTHTHTRHTTHTHTHTHTHNTQHTHTHKHTHTHTYTTHNTQHTNKQTNKQTHQLECSPRGKSTPRGLGEIEQNSFIFISAEYIGVVCSYV
jgi:hypothetical protein